MISIVLNAAALIVVAFSNYLTARANYRLAQTVVELEKQLNEQALQIASLQESVRKINRWMKAPWT